MRAHWIVLGVTGTTMVVALMFNGLVQHGVGRASTLSSRSRPASTALTEAGPVIGLGRDGAIHSARMPPRTVALTFDDGPDATWTPRILSVLRRHHVPATFFVIGARVLAHPELIRRELNDGDEIGSHTFSHANLATVPSWRLNLELRLTQVALAGAVGRHTALLRPPYSSDPEALTKRDEKALRAAAAQGYLIVLADRDGEDWRRPGTGRIVDAAMPSGSDGAVVLLHDGGGNRSETVAALDTLITRLEHRGYHFVTVSQAAGVRTSEAVQRVSPIERVQGGALVFTRRIASLVTYGIAALAFLVGALTVLRAAFLATLARRHAKTAVPAQGSRIAPPVSIVVPAYNEAAGIEATVRALASSDYPTFEIIVVDDGSTDDTAAIVRRLGLDGVKVVEQTNAGKAQALNNGIRHATHEIIVTVDADTVFEPGALRELIQPFRHAGVGAVSGNTKVANRGGLLGRWQHIEYVIGFNLDRRMFDVLGCMPTVPGAIGAFRRSAISDVGGVSDETLAEDTDLTMAIVRAGWKVVYAERAIAWTEAPATVGDLWRQRYRWCFGTLQSIFKHRRAMTGRGTDVKLGRIGLPYLVLFQVMLPLVAPLFDLFLFYGLVFGNRAHLALYFCTFTLVQLALALYAFRLDGEPTRPLATVPLQQVIYRQLMYLVVIQSVSTALVGARMRWQTPRRLGPNVKERPEMDRHGSDIGDEPGDYKASTSKLSI